MTGGRTGLEPALFRSHLNLCLTQGEVYVDGHGGGINGVLCAFGPGQDSVDSPLSLFGPCNDYVSQLTPEMQQWWSSHLRPKFFELTHAALGSHEARKAAWHIALIAVSPERQNRGIGRRLLNAVLQKADTGNARACLEVNNDILVRVFSEFGFRVKATKNFSSYQGGFPLFCMLREPRR
ncbi:hypothetical protein DFH11DRAFT_1725446 [Phellopilus nigrolimitatus]|nr:hypothetical protein DFH11DRAFT_1725446 [Phellopilus nigrolimitatus]